MAASADDAVLEQLGFLERRLHDTDARHAAVLSGLSQADDDLIRTKAIIAALSAEESILRASHSALQGDIESLRSSLKHVRVQKVLANFPKELLQCIFRQAMCCGDKYWPERDGDWRDDEYDWEECSMPFTLAAINVRWRDVALNTADIWNRMQLPSLDRVDGSPFLAYARTLLRRSKNRDLYVILSWVDCDWRKCDFYGRILNSIGKHAHRFRKFIMSVPAGAPETALHFLRLPMPRLEYLCLNHPQPEDGPLLVTHVDSSFTYLQSCPALLRLHNGIFFSIPPRKYSGLISLSIVMDDVPISKIALLLAQCPSLQELELKFWNSQNPDPAIDAEPTSLALSNLRVLGIYGHHDRFVPWAACLQMAHLQELRLADFDEVAGLVPLLEQVADTVTTLVLYELTSDDNLSAEGLQHIKRLHQLRHIVFRFCSFLGYDLSSTLSGRESSGFPHLQSVTIEDPEFDDEQANHASRLMHLLHAASGLATEAAIAFTLDADSRDVPRWLIRQYESIRGDGTSKVTEAHLDSGATESDEKSDSSLEQKNLKVHKSGDKNETN